MSVFCMPGRVVVLSCRLWCRWCSGRRIVCLWAWPLCVLVGGGPPARSPHASLTARSGRSRGPPWPCRRPPAPRPGPPGPPAPRPGAVACSASHPGYRALITEPTANFACNSLTPVVNRSVKSPEFQRLLVSV